MFLKNEIHEMIVIDDSYQVVDEKEIEDLQLEAAILVKSEIDDDKAGLLLEKILSI